MEKQQPIVAILYDFDKTLCTTDMQNYAFIPSLGMTPGEFWAEANGFGRTNRIDGMDILLENCRLHGYFSPIILANSVPAPKPAPDGALTIAREWGLEPASLLFIGDSSSDLAIIKASGLGVAMGNAPDDIKKAADVVTDLNTECGLAKAFETYLF